MVEYRVVVRTYSSTYIARLLGEQASCTAGPKQAVEAVARKVLGKRRFTVEEESGGYDATSQRYSFIVKWKK